MPAELLREIFRPPDQARRARRYWMLPLSIAGHAAAAVAVVIIPLAAEVELPPPAPLAGPAYVKAQPLPPPPAHAASPAVNAPARPGAPTEAADTIAPEVPTAPAGVVTPGPPDVGLTSGDPAGFGVEAAAPALPLPPPPPQPALVRVGGVVREPKRTVDVPPIYPPIARSARVEGIVILEAIISEAGVVERVKVLRSVPLLDGAAIDAVRQWRYTPTLLNGVPVSVLMTITVRFTLNH